MSIFVHKLLRALFQSQQVQRLRQSLKIALRDRVGIFALALVAVGIVFFLVPGGRLQGVGGIVFGTGLTVFLTRLTDRQQLAKEANLRRKTEVYMPLYIELQNLRKWLKEARAGTKPCLQQIDVPRQVSLYQLEEAPRLHHWSEFKADSRYLEFSTASRQMLDQTLNLAMEYNASVEGALKVFETILTTYIQTAISRVVHDPNYQQWRQASPEVLSSSPDNAWFAAIYNAQESQPRSPYAVDPPDWLKVENLSIPEVTWATDWLRGYGTVERKSFHDPHLLPPSPPPLKSRPPIHRPATFGWLLAGNREKALEIICAMGFAPFTSPPPIELLREIMDETWPVLENQPTYREVLLLHEELFNQVSEAEEKFADKLEYIQDIYEGGPPLL